MKMIAHYDEYNEDFRVDLWEESKGFILHLEHEYGYILDPEQREALVPAISRYERTVFWMRITHCLALWITSFEQRH
jgi:hypothetical protein